MNYAWILSRVFALYLIDDHLFELSYNLRPAVQLESAYIRHTQMLTANKAVTDPQPSHGRTLGPPLFATVPVRSDTIVEPDGG